MNKMADITVDPITLDIIENALKSARFEMDEVVRRVSLSPVIREQHDEFPMICDRNGQMVVGQFGSYIPGVLQQFVQPPVGESLLGICAEVLQSPGATEAQKQ